jgi:hypothetical protein
VTLSKKQNPIELLAFVMMAMLLSFIVSNAHCQQPVSAVSIAGSQATPVSQVSWTVTGNQTQSTIYYWVVARYGSAGVAPSYGPVLVNRSPGNLNLDSNNFVSLFWNGVLGASGYDVYKNTSPVSPLDSSNSCASCLVGSNIQVTQVVDNSPTGSSYTMPSLVSQAVATITVDNLSSSTPFLNLKLISNYRFVLAPTTQQTSGTCAQFDDNGNVVSSGSACGAGGGTDTVTSSATLTAGLPIFGNGLKTVTTGTVRGTGTRVQLADGTSPTTGHCANFTATGAIGSSGAPCAGGGGTSYLQSGNAFGATGVLGTTDGFDLSIITNGVQRALVQSGGNFLITNNLQFGGTSSSFPMIKRNSNAFQFRLADDSGFSSASAFNFAANVFQGLTNGVRLNDAGTGIWTMTDSGGTSFTRLVWGPATVSQGAIRQGVGQLVVETGTGSTVYGFAVGNFESEAAAIGGNLTATGAVNQILNSVSLGTTSFAAFNSSNRRGTTAIIQTASSTVAPTSGNCASFDVNGSVQDAGVACGGGSTTVTTYGSLPAAGVAGRTFLLTNSWYSSVYDTGSVLRYFIDGKEQTPPTAASTWTLVTSGNATKADNVGAVSLSTSSNNVNSAECLLKAEPATPYTKIFHLRSNALMVGTGETFTVGAGWSNGLTVSSALNLGRLFRSQFSNNYFAAQTAAWTNFSFAGETNSNLFPYTTYSIGDFYVRVTNNATNKILELSGDGVSFITLQTLAVATPFTPTHYGFCATLAGATGRPWTVNLVAEY